MTYQIFFGMLPSHSITNCIAPTTNYIKKLNNINGFFSKLEDHVLCYGFINPILVQAGYCNAAGMKWISDINNILCCDRNGGSRLMIAQKHNLEIPCIISDFVGRFKNLELLSKETICSKYNYPPKQIIVNDYGVHVLDSPQIHL